MSVGAKGCGAQYERPGGRQHDDRIVSCTLPFGHVGDHEERDADGEVLNAWTRAYRPRTPQVVPPGVAAQVEELTRQIQALASDVATLQEARGGPMRTPTGHAIPPLPPWLVSAASRTADPGLALGFAGSAWVSAWMAATAQPSPAAEVDG